MKFDMKSLMKQAQQMQSDLAKKQEELAAKHFEASAGGGMVTVTVSGAHEIVKIKIDPAIVNPNDVEMLEDLVTAAMNEGFKKVADALKTEMSGMMGGMGGMPNIFG